MIIIAAVSGPSPRWEPRPSNSDKRTWSRLTLVLWAVIGNVQCCANQTILSDTYPCTPSPPLGAPSSVVWTWFLFFISNELSLVVPSLFLHQSPLSARKFYLSETENNFYKMKKYIRCKNTWKILFVFINEWLCFALLTQNTKKKYTHSLSNEVKTWLTVYNICLDYANFLFDNIW